MSYKEVITTKLFICSVIPNGIIMYHNVCDFFLNFHILKCREDTVGSMSNITEFYFSNTCRLYHKVFLLFIHPLWLNSFWRNMGAWKSFNTHVLALHSRNIRPKNNPRYIIPSSSVKTLTFSFFFYIANFQSLFPTFTLPNFFKKKNQFMIHISILHKRHYCLRNLFSQTHADLFAGKKYLI